MTNRWLRDGECLLSGLEQTRSVCFSTSANDPERTFCEASGDSNWSEQVVNGNGNRSRYRAKQAPSQARHFKTGRKPVPREPPSPVEYTALLRGGSVAPDPPRTGRFNVIGRCAFSATAP